VVGGGERTELPFDRESQALIASKSLATVLALGMPRSSRLAGPPAPPWRLRTRHASMTRKKTREWWWRWSVWREVAEAGAGLQVASGGPAVVPVTAADQRKPRIAARRAARPPLAGRTRRRTARPARAR